LLQAEETDVDPPGWSAEPDGGLAQ
jgi:hypothetical protein